MAGVWLQRRGVFLGDQRFKPECVYQWWLSEPVLGLGGESMARRWLFPEHLSKVQESLAMRADALFKPLHQAFQGTELNVREPHGGYFVWIDMPASC